MEHNLYQVCILNSKRDYFDYLGGHHELAIGNIVLAPFIKSERIGIVIGIEKGMPRDKLKTISEVLDYGVVVPPPILTLCQWIATYYQIALSEVLPFVIPKKIRSNKSVNLPQKTDYYGLKNQLETDALLSGRQRKLRELFARINQDKHPINENILLKEGFSKQQLASLLEKKIIAKIERDDLDNFVSNQTVTGPELNPEQAEAVQHILANLKRYHCYLLQGVTGSGKTEVYLNVINQVLSDNKQVLLLVPEIGLTPQLLDRFKARFVEPIVVIHSHLNDSERAIAWQLARQNTAKLIIGTRTAIFTPLPNLGLIIVDEEHDASFKQLDKVRYNARDAAIMRAHFSNIPIIMGSATPCLESIYNYQQHKYDLLRLDNKAVSKIPLHFQLQDLRTQQVVEGLTETSLQRIKQHLEKQQQVLVFINRRGFSPILLCALCSWIVDCRRCDSHLTFHQAKSCLICHHCGYVERLLSHCRQCNHNQLVPIGVGTERLFQTLNYHFPHAKIAKVDRDQVGKKDELDKILDDIKHNRIELIIGTQMLAKGHDFPNLSLVVVVDTDAAFYNHDFRSLEQFGQLVTQVAGRAGRATVAGEVIIQTYLPHHPLLNILIQQGYEAFAKQLLITRQQASFPPYQFLAVIRAEDKKKDKVDRFLAEIKTYLTPGSLQLLGPAPAPLARKAHFYRMQLVLKCANRTYLQQQLTAMRSWVTTTKFANNLRWSIDVDPYDLS